MTDEMVQEWVRTLRGNHTQIYNNDPRVLPSVINDNLTQKVEVK